MVDVQRDRLVAWSHKIVGSVVFAVGWVYVGTP